MDKEATIYLPICLHFHQPIDNFDFVFEDVFEKAYNPLIKNLLKYPEIN